MTRRSPQILKAMLHFEDALTALERAVSDQNDRQERLDKLAKQLDPILRTLNSGMDAQAHSRLTFLRKKIFNVQLALARARERTALARQSYREAAEAFEAKFYSLSDSADDLRREISTRDRREYALSRSLQALLDAKLGQASDELDLPKFQTPIGSYSYISIYIPRFENLLINLDRALTADARYEVEGARYRPVSFVEVGCGTGRNVFLAKTSGLVIFDRVTGFDIDETNVLIGQKAFELGENLFIGDALEHDYSDYDVVFSYRPFSNNDWQTALEARIVETMPEGGYFLAPYALDLGVYPELAPVGDNTEIWQKAGYAAPAHSKL